jgi:PAS domain S-box-containing protein
MWAIVRDITERKQAEKGLRRAEKQYRDIFEDALEGIYRTSPEGKSVAANPALARMLGFSSVEECVSAISSSGSPAWLDPEDQRAFLKLLEERDIVRGYECRCRRKDGSKIWVSLSTRRVPGPDGTTVHYEGFVEDITERKRSEEAQRQQAAFNELMTGILTDFVICSPSQVDAAVAKALESAAGFIGADHSLIIRFAPDLRSWSATHEWCGPGVSPRLAQFQRVPMGTIPRNEQRLLNGQIVRINSSDDYPQEAVEERRARSAEGHFSDLTVPVRTKDGIWNCIGLHSHERPVTWSDDDVARLRMVGEAVATALERKETMEVLRKSEEKFSKAFHASPVAMTILSVATGRCIEVNRAYEENTGLRAEQIIGRSPGELGIYTGSDGPGNIDKLVIEREGLRNLELQYRSKGRYPRTALFSTELIEFGGEPCSLLVLEDITERKRIEQGLREIGARILLVQEEERRRVARELHDDFSQRLALLAIDLEQLAQRPPSAGHEWSARLESMWSQTQELTSDLHRLSYQLHPSKLEDLGLVTAVRSYCHGLLKQAGLEVRFSDANVPRVLPKEISLCLYRIVQEALHNVVKHSGVKTATVDLSGGPNEVRLVVSDSGRGFVVNAAPGIDGLGLVSMQERVRHVGGLWSIESHPFGGTRIVVRIPVPSHSARQQRIAG